MRETFELLLDHNRISYRADERLYYDAPYMCAAAVRALLGRTPEKLKIILDTEEFDDAQVRLYGPHGLWRVKAEGLSPEDSEAIAPLLEQGGVELYSALFDAVMYMFGQSSSVYLKLQEKKR